MKGLQRNVLSARWLMLSDHQISRPVLLLCTSGAIRTARAVCMSKLGVLLGQLSQDQLINSTCLMRNRATVRRVVLTSSVAAVRSSGSSTPPVNPPLFSERDWNEVRGRMPCLGSSLVSKRILSAQVHTVKPVRTVSAAVAGHGCLHGRKASGVMFSCDSGLGIQRTHGVRVPACRIAPSRREHTR